MMQKIDQSHVSKVRDGVYVGANCSIIMDRGWISIVVNDDQLEMLKKYKNYEFHFDEHGDFSGTGTGIAAHFVNQGEILYKLSEKSEETILEENTLRRVINGKYVEEM